MAVILSFTINLCQNNNCSNVAACMIPLITFQRTVLNGQMFLKIRKKHLIRVYSPEIEGIFKVGPVLVYVVHHTVDIGCVSSLGVIQYGLAQLTNLLLLCLTAIVFTFYILKRLTRLDVNSHLQNVFRNVTLYSEQYSVVHYIFHKT